MTAQDPGRACDEYWERINDYVDGALGEAARSEVAQHLDRCPACGRAAADLGQMRRAAQSLPPRRPRADAWQRIAAELSRELPAPPAAAAAGLWTRQRLGWAAAAVLVLAVASTVWFVRQPNQTAGGQQASTQAAPGIAPAATPVNPSQTDLVKSIDDELRAAESHYEKAISGLEQIAKSDQNQLDPALAATLQKNLGVIDQAIRDSRTALQSQPASQLAQDSLFEALQRKVSLLEDTISLINVMRKGDQAGTARIVQGTTKS
jgi:tetratricopeptide (TPR) repeat protein